jgi:nucleoside-diphosphate-sugar epimerase
VRVFVAGGTGHSGSYIIPELIAAGHEVTGLARSDTAAAAVSARRCMQRAASSPHRRRVDRGDEDVAPARPAGTVTAAAGTSASTTRNTGNVMSSPCDKLTRESRTRR